MQHGKKNRKFGRETKQRKELMRDLAESFILRGKIKTTRTKAKSLRPFVEKMITKSKNKNLSSTKLLVSKLGKMAARKLINEIGPKFADQNGGYTRIINLPSRISDGAQISIIEFIK